MFIAPFIYDDLKSCHTATVLVESRCRPAYRRLSRLRKSLPRVPLMALTATATAKVQNDIVASLGLRSPARLAASFNRPNIIYAVK